MPEINKKNGWLSEIRACIAQEKADYRRYNFSQDQNDILKTFFDLSQDFTTLDDFYQICVSVIDEFMGVKASLYLVRPSNSLELICDSKNGLYDKLAECPVPILLSESAYATDESWVVPIISKAPRVELGKVGREDILLGMLEFGIKEELTDQEKFFLAKYANRIGYNLYNRQVAQQNVEHIKFINNLVMDIEHNVIIPNMYFRHLFNQIRYKIRDVGALEEKMVLMKNSLGIEGHACEDVIRRVSVLHQDLVDYHQEILKHHNNCSLFLESLFRRDHFEKGHLVLHSKKCFVETEVILPQLEQFAHRFRVQGITVDRPSDMSSEQIPLTVDIGLLSQVYANFFSNAVKYTEEIIDHAGKPRKSLAYGRSVLPDYFGPGRWGIKFNVFSTGRHLDSEDAVSIFKEGYRGKNITLQSGSGHGLTFVKQVVEMHGGEVGYEATTEGNNFFFILPIEDEI